MRECVRVEEYENEELRETRLRRTRGFPPFFRGIQQGDGLGSGQGSQTLGTMNTGC